MVFACPGRLYRGADSAKVRGAGPLGSADTGANGDPRGKGPGWLFECLLETFQEEWGASLRMSRGPLHDKGREAVPQQLLCGVLVARGELLGEAEVGHLVPKLIRRMLRGKGAPQQNVEINDVREQRKHSALPSLLILDSPLLNS